MNRRRSCQAILIAASTGLGSCTVAAQGAALPGRRMIFNATGRMLPWVMAVEYPWIGGNYYEMEVLGRAIDNDAIRVVVDSLREAVRDKDAGLLQVDDLLHHARHRDVRYTDVVIAATPGNVGPTFAEDEVKAWRMTGRLLVTPGLAPDAEVLFRKIEQPLSVGGLRSYAAVFTIKAANEGDQCKVIAIVPLGSRGSHMFVLNVAASRWQQRFDELAAMLGRMQYEPGLLKDAGAK